MAKTRRKRPPAKDTLAAKIKEAETLRRRLQRRPNEKDAARLTTLATELTKVFQKLGRRAHEMDLSFRRPSVASPADPTTGDTVAALPPVEATSRGVAGAAAPATKSASTTTTVTLVDDNVSGLAPFMKDVSESLIEAQRTLDLASLRNLTSPASLHVPPTYYAIPSVKAELKVGLTKGAKKGFNLVFFADQKTRSDFSENTVSFEVVATPPPPGTHGPFTVPIPGFLAVDVERAQLLARAEVALRERIGTDLNMLYMPHRDAALVARRPNLEGTIEYLVVWPAADKGSNGAPTRVAAVACTDADTVETMVVPLAQPFTSQTANDLRTYITGLTALLSLVHDWIPRWLALITLPVSK